MLFTLLFLQCIFSLVHSLGTGKSVTGAHIAYVLARLNRIINTSDSHKCVLYCGPSNKSVDVVFSKFQSRRFC